MFDRVSLDKVYKEKNNKFNRKLCKTGTSYCVTIPPTIVKKLSLENGVTVKTEANKIIIASIS